MKIPKSIVLFLLSFVCNISAQEMNSDNQEITEAYNLATNTIKINTRRGILAAGGDYGGEWTRDISVNSWNGVSLIYPAVAEKSLWSVTIGKDTVGHQFWDKIIWVIAAYNHYKITGDLAFLKDAYRCAANTMNQLEEMTFDKEYGLFKGPSFFNDGIAAYPEPIYEQNNFSSFVLDYKNSYKIKCLSTNCLYYGAYAALIQMSRLLNEANTISSTYELKARDLKNNIQKYFYDKDNNKLYYLIDQNGNVSKYQEGTGISFAIMFGILDSDKAHQLISNAEVSKYGITSIYPDFPRYSSEKPGRHNNIVWPVVNGFFAQAAALTRSYDKFSNELNNLTSLALDEDKGNYNFREIYNPYTGKPDGGYQDRGKEDPYYHWESCRLQTWSATAYINMIYYGLAGLRINNNDISFSPFLPSNIHYLELNNIIYRKSRLNIVIKGNGSKIKTFLLNGKKQSQYSIDQSIKGINKIIIEVE
ncbi:MAG: hypothetical protein Q8940_07085 [Bacteroidota bacterium]|nr:hypothetical protein [Bacteroidota bacterium]